MRTPSLALPRALEASLVSIFPASGIVGSFRSRWVALYREWAGPTSGLLWRGLGLLRPGMPRVLGAPGAEFGAVEDAVVIGIHLVEAGPGPLRSPILGVLNELVPRDAAIACRSGRRGSRTLDSGGLRSRLSEGYRRQQGQSDDGHEDVRAHLLRLSVD